MLSIVTEIVILGRMARAQTALESRRDLEQEMLSRVLVFGTTSTMVSTSGEPPPPVKPRLLADEAPQRMFTSPITIQNTYSWGNGFNRWGFSPFEGDGNGFKLSVFIVSQAHPDSQTETTIYSGGGTTSSASHVVTNSVAFLNAVKGFTDNSQPGSMVLTANTAYNNGGEGFNFKTAKATLKQNLSALNKAGTAGLGSGVTASGNSWNLSGTWSNSSFVSVSSSQLTGPRLANGSIVATPFLTPTASAPSTTVGARIWGI